jgi:hypothetical protein
MTRQPKVEKFYLSGNFSNLSFGTLDIENFRGVYPHPTCFSPVDVPVTRHEFCAQRVLVVIPPLGGCFPVKIFSSPKFRLSRAKYRHPTSFSPMGNGPVEEGLGRAFQHGTGTSSGEWPR